MMRTRIAKVLTSVAVLYVIFPFIAGLLAIGDRDGPKIYPRSYHTALYIISYEMVRDEKPRQNIQLERPWFYGLPKRRTVSGSKEQQ